MYIVYSANQLIHNNEQEKDISKYILFVAMLLLTRSLYAQSMSERNKEREEKYGVCKKTDVKPSFVGGRIAMERFVYDNLKYPVSGQYYS